MTIAAAPLLPITPPQLRCLHALARKRGLSHEDLRAVAGVTSLKLLSVSAANVLIDKLQLDRPDGGRGGRARTGERRPRLSTDATGPQRGLIAYLFEQLGWDADKARGWLRARHFVNDLARDHIDRAEATQIINELKAALRKKGNRRGAKERRA